MKKILLLLLALPLVSCSDKERNCKDFKTGTFEFTQVIDGKKLTSTFVRTDSLQIETFNGKTDTATVRWVNDCEFVLRKLHPKTMNERKAISMTILSTDKNSYTFDYSFVGDSKKHRGTVTKLK
ncbi:DNA topoisomerase IV [Flavobacterium silvisoli]|uniref:DNA topoisomerase IV n=1 Tax=Flavobacterium silvisoli TaxID=2529433 RepID=A0A4Q9YZE5_9FLAO|nr:DNA topoisomerase IV [Flavobacterium silvisoli]TBX67521.1 DNA topoisomerase IV [Flavobacterium silvisoli]